jgi:hypothetical protein
MTENHYSALFKVHIPKEIETKILELMEQEREFNRKKKDIPDTLYLVHCNCSDRSIECNPCDGYVSDFYPNVIFVDPESRKELMSIFAHELIHIYQEYRYIIFNDEYEDNYRERWFEKMSFSLQDKVREILDDNIVLECIEKDDDAIDDFLVGLMKDNGVFDEFMNELDISSQEY